MRSVSVLGATGSVGESAFDLLIRAGGAQAFRTVALTGGANVARLAQMARALRAEIAVTAWPGKLAELRERFANIELDDKSNLWNTEWLSAIELDYQLDVAQTIVHSAINRKESRGAHQRLDGYEQRDDVNFLKHSEAYYVPGSAPRIAYGEVKITKSQPAARVYGAAGEKADAERKASHV